MAMKNRKIISVVLDEADATKLESLEEKTGLSKSTQIRVWVKEKLNSLEYKPVDLNKFRTGGE
mgnify:CR=1 FL=1